MYLKLADVLCTQLLLALELNNKSRGIYLLYGAMAGK